MNVFYKLTNKANNGQLIKEENPSGREFRYDNGEWVRTSVLMDYLNPYGRFFDQYKVLTEEQALAEIA